MSSYNTPNSSTDVVNTSLVTNNLSFVKVISIPNFLNTSSNLISCNAFLASRIVLVASTISGALISIFWVSAIFLYASANDVKFLTCESNNFCNLYSCSTCSLVALIVSFLASLVLTSAVNKSPSCSSSPLNALVIISICFWSCWSNFNLCSLIPSNSLSAWFTNEDC